MALGHGVSAQQDVFKEAHSSILGMAWSAYTFLIKCNQTKLCSNMLSISVTFLVWGLSLQSFQQWHHTPPCTGHHHAPGTTEHHCAPGTTAHHHAPCSTMHRAPPCTVHREMSEEEVEEEATSTRPSPVPVDPESGIRLSQTAPTRHQRWEAKPKFVRP